VRRDGGTRFSGTSGYYGGDAAFGVAVDEAEKLYVGGYTVIASGTVWTYVERHDAVGVTEWHQEYGNPDSGTWCWPGRIALADGSLYSVGRTRPISNDWQVAVRKFDQGGTPGWMTTWGISGSAEQGNDVAVSGNDIFVTGTQGSALLLLKLHDDGGSVSFAGSTVYTGTGTTAGYGIVATNGWVYTVGSTDIGGQTEALLLAYDTNLNLQWDYVWGGTGMTAPTTSPLTAARSMSPVTWAIRLSSTPTTSTRTATA